MPGILLNTFARSESLEERIGQRTYGVGGVQPVADLARRIWGTWIRGWGDFADIRPGTSTAGSSWDAANWGLQAGFDTPLGDHPGGELILGVNFRYAQTDADIVNLAGTGRIEAEGYGFGSTLTWFGHDGLYVDTQATVHWVSTDAWSSGAGVLLDGRDDTVFALSGEVGKRFLLDDGLALVPQVQLTWGTLGDDSFTDALGNVVAFGDTDSLIGRAGLAVERSFTGATGRDGKIYAFGNILHDLAGDKSVTVAGTELAQSGAGTWGEIGGGFSLPASDALSVFAQASYRHALSGVDGDGASVSGRAALQLVSRGCGRCFAIAAKRVGARVALPYFCRGTKPGASHCMVAGHCKIVSFTAAPPGSHAPPAQIARRPSPSGLLVFCVWIRRSTCLSIDLFWNESFMGPFHREITIS
jgi:fibronectin-binding autotransporter adhesin